MTDSDVTVFCRQVRSRSEENGLAIMSLNDQGLTGNVISVLRQELDSMIRCIFLLTVKDLEYRNRLIRDTVNQRRWRTQDSQRTITDRDMVELSMHLHGWTKMVYKFGCAFIHLSAYHDYPTRDPLETLSKEDRDNLAGFLENYHGVHLRESDSFADIVHVLPAVFKKISSNLECYLRDLEANSELQ